MVVVVVVVVTVTVTMRAALIMHVVVCAVGCREFRMYHLLALRDEFVLVQHARRTQALQPSQSLLPHGADGPNAIR